MASMHSDMSGSAAVVGLFKALSLNKVEKNVVGVMALTENMLMAVLIKMVIFHQ